MFTVVGTTGKPHAIRLFLKESCTCPATSTCYHILAVCMSIGLEGSSQKKSNLTQLRCNTRSRAEMQNIPTQNNGFDCGVFVCMVSSVGCVCNVRITLIFLI